MDAVDFLREYRRMCNKYAYAEACGEDCADECPLKDCYCDVRYKNTDIESTVSKVEQWSKEHPRKTMMQDFFEKFPNAPVSRRSTGSYKIPIPCPSDCGYVINDSNKDCDRFNGNCIECWSRPLED